MKLLKTINIDNIDSQTSEKFEVRHATRAVVFDNNNKIGILHVTKHNYHKLPGGGLDDEEENITGLKRECQEELGCDIEITDELGSIIEYREKFLLKQESYCYIAKVVGDKGAPSFEQGEIDDGFEIKWVSPEKAIELLENDKPDDYEGKFIQIRDLFFLKQSQYSSS